MEQSNSQPVAYNRGVTIGLFAAIGLAVLTAALWDRVETFYFFYPLLKFLPVSIWKIITQSAEGAGAFALLIYYGFSRKSLPWWLGWSVTVLLGSVLPGIIKRLWFADFPRPWLLMAEHLKPLEGIEPAFWFSFPSGHTAAAAALAFFGAWTARHKAEVFILITWSLMVGLSRIALHMHWWIDAVGGWCLGAAMGAFALSIARAKCVSLILPKGNIKSIFVR